MSKYVIYTGMKNKKTFTVERNLKSAHIYNKSDNNMQHQQTTTTKCNYTWGWDMDPVIQMRYSNTYIVLITIRSVLVNNLIFLYI